MGKRRRLTLEWPPPRAEPAGLRRAPQHLARTLHIEAIYQVRDVQVSFSASRCFTFIFSKLWDSCVLIAKPSGSIDSDREAGDRICASSSRGPPIRLMSVPACPLSHPRLFCAAARFRHSTASSFSAQRSVSFFKGTTAPLHICSQTYLFSLS